MSPIFTVQYLVDFGAGNSKPIGYFTMACSLFSEFKYFCNIFRFKLCVPPSFSCFKSSFGFGVSNILQLASKPQMLGVHAIPPVPTRTIVIDLKSLGYFSIKVHPRRTVSPYALGMCKSIFSVPATCRFSHPKPTRWSEEYFSQKSFWYGIWNALLCDLRNARVVLHNKFSLLCRAPGCSFSAGAIFMLNTIPIPCNH